MGQASAQGAARPAIHRFSELLEQYPAGFDGNRLNLLLLEQARPITDGRAYLRQLASPALLDEQREFLLDEACPWPFPRYTIGERPDPWEVSARLFERFEEARQMLPSQRDIAERVVGLARRAEPDVVALIIVDGLSYYDLAEDVAAEPCLVDGITVTEYGYRQVVGQPSLSRRLFALGYAQQLGFSYFDPAANDLARDIYGSFSEAQCRRVSAFDEVLHTLSQTHLSRAYVQITLAGLDQVSHHHHDRPPRDHYVERVLAHYNDLIACLAKQHRRMLVVLTADHGLLWREVMEGRAEIVGDLFPEDARSPRYIKGALRRGYSRCCRCDGQNYTLFAVPHMARRFRNDEWGVHGGISAWESVVPLMIYPGPTSAVS